ncbi:glycosyltransferase family 4 protein [Gordonia sp. NPDC003585]|uniref:glycosyltransferase family 4 protein n=1 Tax=Gordonia sp. NPDC003585 TaxID=3154275 RepID=UPI0033AA97C6
MLDQGPGLWGAQKYLLRLHPLLAAMGIEFTLGCPPDLEQYRYWHDHDLPVVPMPLPVERSIRDGGRISLRRTISEAGRSASTPRRIAREVRSGGYQLVLANSHWTHLDAAVAARMWGVRTVLTLHETPVPGVGAGLRDVAIASANHSIAVSNSVADTVAARLRRRVTVIQNGVDTARFAPASGDAVRRRIRAEAGLSVDRPIVLAATRLDPSKHIEDLIVLADAIGHAATVVVAGSTSAYPEYEAQMCSRASALPEPAIRFLGARNDVADLLAAADVFVHTGLVEGMPLGLVEAQATGVPVVAYEAAGVREALRDNVSGYVIAPRDRAGLTQAVTRLLGSVETRRSFSAAARDHALAHHGIDSQAAANAAVLRRLAKPREHAGPGRR